MLRVSVSTSRFSLIPDIVFSRMNSNGNQQQQHSEQYRKNRATETRLQRLRMHGTHNRWTCVRGRGGKELPIRRLVAAGKHRCNENVGSVFATGHTEWTLRVTDFVISLGSPFRRRFHCNRKKRSSRSCFLSLDEPRINLVNRSFRDQITFESFRNYSLNNMFSALWSFALSNLLIRYYYEIITPPSISHYEKYQYFYYRSRYRTYCTRHLHEPAAHQTKANLRRD